MISHHFLKLLVIMFLHVEFCVQNEIYVQEIAICPIGYYYNLTNSTCNDCSTALKYCF